MPITTVIAPADVSPKAPPKGGRGRTKPPRVIVDEMKGRRVLDCNLCEKLCGSRKMIVNGHGPRHARVAVIAEAPGEVEDQYGRPLIGPAGQTIRNWLDKCGIDPEDVYYDNAVKCRPEGNKTPTAREIKNCNEHLWHALEWVQPDVIIACGNTAVAALLPEAVAKEGITKVRGHVFWNKRLQRKIIPTFHPSAAFHDFGLEIFCLADIAKALKEAKHPTKLPPGLGDYKAILDVDDVEALCARLEKSDLLVFDTETSHSAKLTCEEAGDKGALDWRGAQVLCIGLTDEVEKGYIIPVVGQNFREIWKPSEWHRVLNAVGHLMESDVPKIAQNGKFDVHMLRMMGIWVNNFAFDTMLAYALIHESASHALEPMRSLFTTMPFYDDAIYDCTDGKAHMERAPEDMIWKYCGADVDCTLRVAKAVDKLLDDEGEKVRWIFENISMPAQAAATHIEERGVMIDMELAAHILEETDRLIEKTDKVLYEAIPEQWRVAGLSASWQKKQKLLYTQLNLPLPPVLTKTGSNCKACRNRETQHWFHTSTDKNAIKELEGSHPVIAPLQTVIQLHTLKKTFLLGEDDEEELTDAEKAARPPKKRKATGLLQHVGADQRIHTSYGLANVETGRWSSSPNLQNIPKEKDERPEVYQLIRKLFIAPKGRKLVEVDFSQLELRVLAYMSGEAVMIEKFENNEDFHLYTARNVLFKKLDPEMLDDEWKRVHKDKRDGAKVFNFGVPYGLTAWGVSQRFHCSEEEGGEYITDFNHHFTQVHGYFNQSDRDLKRRHQRKNALGRTRHFFGVDTMQHFGGYRRMLGHMKREAYNYPIQSTGSDILSLSTIAVDNDPWFEAHGAFIVLSVHDSLTLECPEEYAADCGRRVQKHFARAGRKNLDWYLPGECQIGQRWSDWDYMIDVNGEIKAA